MPFENPTVSCCSTRFSASGNPSAYGVFAMFGRLTTTMRASGLLPRMVVTMAWMSRPNFSICPWMYPAWLLPA